MSRGISLKGMCVSLDQNRRIRQSYVITLFVGDSEAAGGPLSKQASSQLWLLPCGRAYPGSWAEVNHRQQE